MTNAEKIRSMTDEELSVLLAEFNHEYEADCIVDTLSNERTKCFGGSCTECIKNFLQEEVKE